LLFLAFSGNSHKPPAALKARQAAHAYRAYFLGSSMHRLAARYCPSGGTHCFVQSLRIFGFCGDV